MSRSFSVIPVSREKTFVTRQGDVLDAIVQRHYGQVTAGLLNAVMVRNPFLYALPVVLPANHVIVLPPITPATAKASKRRLWVETPAAKVVAPVTRSPRKGFKAKTQEELDEALKKFRAQRLPAPVREPSEPDSYHVEDQPYTYAGDTRDPYGSLTAAEAYGQLI